MPTTDLHAGSEGVSEGGLDHFEGVAEGVAEGVDLRFEGIEGVIGPIQLLGEVHALYSRSLATRSKPYGAMGHQNPFDPFESQVNPFGQPLRRSAQPLRNPFGRAPLPADAPDVTLRVAAAPAVAAAPPSCPSCGGPVWLVSGECGNRPELGAHPMTRHLVSTAATLTRCRSCGAQVLHGYAEGLLVFVDLTPIPPAAADALTAAGWPTYVHTHTELVHRDDTRTQLAGVLLAEHRCTPKEK